MPDLGLVLEEIRACRGEIIACRKEISDSRKEYEGRLSPLEVHDRECYGNGQPGWKEKFEKRISTIEGKALLVTGGALVLGAIGHFVVDHFFK